MATTFDPDIEKTNDPSYGGTSRPIDIPDTIKPTGVQQNQILPEGVKMSDKSAEYLGQAEAYKSQAEGSAVKGFADLFAGVATFTDQLGKMGDYMIKKDIENQVYDIANKERQQYTQGLELLKQRPGGTANLLDAKASMGDDGEAEAPQEIDNIPETFGALKSARDAGKVSNTYYYSQLTAAAKDLRARHPGYRDYIDKQFATVTGVNPANAYISSLVRDINASSSKVATESNRMRTFITQNMDKPGAEKMMADFEAGKISSFSSLIQWAAPYEQRKAALARDAAELANWKGTREAKITKAETHAENLAATAVSNNMQNLLLGIGIDTPEKAIEFVERAKSGDIPQEAWREKAVQLTQMRNNMRRNLLAQGSQGGENSIVSNIGAKKWGEIIDAQLKPMDDAVTQITNKDIGGIYAASSWIKSNTDEATKNLLQNNKVGPYYTQVQVMRNLGGEQWFTKFNLNTIKDNVDQQYEEYYHNWKREIHSQTKANTAGGTVVTFNDMMDDMKTKGVSDRAVNQKMLSMVDSITAKDTPDAIRVNVAKAAFDPNNQGMMKRITSDKQSFYFSNWTSPGMTSQMAELGKKDPTLWQNYRNWAENTFGNEIFPRELADLNKQAKQLNLKVEWNPETKGLQVSNPLANQGRLGVGGNTPYYRSVESSIQRINMGLRSMENIAVQQGSNVETYLLKTLRDSGVDIKDISGVPAQIVNSLVGSRTGFTNGGVGKSNYSADNGKPAGPSVSEFTSNPTGNIRAPRQMNLTGSNTNSEVVDVQNIPEGMDPNEYIRQLRNQRR